MRVQVNKITDKEERILQSVVGRVNAHDFGAINLWYFNEYNNYQTRVDWVIRGDNDEAFYFGDHFTEEQINLLDKRAQMAVAINRTRPLIRHAVAMFTANTPSFTVTGRTDADNRKAWLFKEVIARDLHDNFFPRLSSRAVFDMLRRGLGNILVDFEPSGRMGKGMIVLDFLTNREVINDPFSSDWGFGNADNQIVTKVVSKRMAYEMFPDHLKDIDEVANSFTYDFQARDIAYSTEDKDYIVVDRENEGDSILGDRIRIIQRYTKARIPVWIVKSRTGAEREYYDPKKLMEFAEKSYSEGRFHGEDYIVERIDVERVKRYTSIVDRYVKGEILPTDTYPVISFVNEDTRNPFPMSDITPLRPMQNVLNKCFGIALYSAQTAANQGIFVDEGEYTSGEAKQLEDQMAVPGHVLPIKGLKDGLIQIHNSQPIQPAWLQIVELLQKQMEFQISIFPQDMGDPKGAHRTFKGTLAIHEWGAKTAQLTLRSLNDSFTLMGKVVLDYIQAYYKKEDVIRLTTDIDKLPDDVVDEQKQSGLLDDNNNLIINKAIKEAGEVSEYLNDLTVGKYDLAVIPDSFLYTNKIALTEYYLELKREGILDAIAVLNTLDIKDRDEIKKRNDIVEQLKQIVETLAADNKELRSKVSQSERDIVRKDRAVKDAQYTAKLEGVKAHVEAESRANLREQKKKNIPEKGSK